MRSIAFPLLSLGLLVFVAGPANAASSARMSGLGFAYGEASGFPGVMLLDLSMSWSAPQNNNYVGGELLMFSSFTGSFDTVCLNAQLMHFFSIEAVSGWYVAGAAGLAVNLSNANVFSDGSGQPILVTSGAGAGADFHLTGGYSFTLGDWGHLGIGPAFTLLALPGTVIPVAQLSASVYF